MERVFSSFSAMAAAPVDPVLLVAGPAIRFLNSSGQCWLAARYQFRATVGGWHLNSHFPKGISL